ncbi:hypothetical protein HRM2_14080 [Desulforapulum autotrophicum HRM2]|uniref:Uncharacterized protein n=1 Tax=Desulforapulum autotrophicum (strain ATCC 43914 / DSM 3382 / VKM B-1955 / HRM2) TaxID=177437 RepID=C0Q9F3_DESAH|nr:hypothetical protein HRM2_14080 [Desulforapulum autotrophicum HRM2]
MNLDNLLVSESYPMDIIPMGHHQPTARKRNGWGVILLPGSVHLKGIRHLPAKWGLKGTCSFNLFKLKKGKFS